MHVDPILSCVPDPGAWDRYARWFEDVERGAHAYDVREQEDRLVSVAGADLAFPQNPQGRFGIERFRRFLGALLAADWLTYAAPDDRANLLRLGFVLERFPEGFRAWFAPFEGGWIPVGYSGWYPIDEPTFQRLETNDPPWRDRAIVPMTSVSAGDFLYLFNYSILPQLRRGEGSRKLLGALSEAILPVQSRGIAAITVSEDGSRVARRFELSFRHEIRVGASREEIWTSGV